MKNSAPERAIENDYENILLVWAFLECPSCVQMLPALLSQQH